MLRDAPDGAPQHERFFNAPQAFSVRPENFTSAALVFCANEPAQAENVISASADVLRQRTRSG
jgi:hypothetical protein